MRSGSRVWLYQPGAPRRGSGRGVNAPVWAAAIALAGASWLHQVVIEPEPSLSVFADRAVFLFCASCAVLLLFTATAWAPMRTRVAEDGWRPPSSHRRNSSGHVPPTGRDVWGTWGAVLLALIVLIQTVTHLDSRAPFLYLTIPGYPNTSGSLATAYVFWLEGHPTFSESWQFARQAAVYGGASHDLTTGLTDARAAYAYLAALLATPLGYFPSFVAVNVAFWFGASLATWYVAGIMLGGRGWGLIAALLTAAGQGFVLLVGTPMSYVAGYAWAAILLAVATRWRLFRRASSFWRWVLWGWLCGTASLFYFTHLTALASAWLFGLRRARPRNLAAATAAALLPAALWFLAGTYAVGLHFEATTADDLARQSREFVSVAVQRPLLLSSYAGSGTFRALLGAFGLPVLALAATGMVRAPSRRRDWYMAVFVSGFCPAFVLHHLPAVQRYGYLAYPALYIAAVDGSRELATRVGRALATRRSGALTTPPSTGRVSSAVAMVAVGALAAYQLIQANADLAGNYRFALAFGAP